jgi:hypothetical protein
MAAPGPISHLLPPNQQLLFQEWKTALYRTAAAENRLPHVCNIPDHILVLFWADGCDPTISHILSFSEGKRADSQAA